RVPGPTGSAARGEAAAAYRRAPRRGRPPTSGPDRSTAKADAAQVAPWRAAARPSRRRSSSPPHPCRRRTADAPHEAPAREARRVEGAGGGGGRGGSLPPGRGTVGSGGRPGGGRFGSGGRAPPCATPPAPAAPGRTPEEAVLGFPETPPRS